MDDFGSQVGSQLDTGLENSTYVVIRKQNIVFRVDLLTTRKKVKWIIRDLELLLAFICSMFYIYQSSISVKME